MLRVLETNVTEGKLRGLLDALYKGDNTFPPSLSSELA